jgi:hypothetical protein
MPVLAAESARRYAHAKLLKSRQLVNPPGTPTSAPFADYANETAGSKLLRLRGMIRVQETDCGEFGKTSTID